MSKVNRKHEKITEETFLKVFLILSAKLKPEDMVAHMQSAVHPSIIASQVSSRYKQIILGYPPLWRKLIVHNLCKDLSAYANMWLERLRHLPPEVFISLVFPLDRQSTFGRIPGL